MDEGNERVTRVVVFGVQSLCGQATWKLLSQHGVRCDRSSPKHSADDNEASNANLSFKFCWLRNGFQFGGARYFFKKNDWRFIVLWAAGCRWKWTRSEWFHGSERIQKG